jgi:two-component system sensor histidine kinase CreC
MQAQRRNRVFAGILLIYALGIALLMYRLIADLDPRYRESAEDSLIETAHLLASALEQDAFAGSLNTARLPELFERLYQRPVEARIFSIDKTRIDLRVYVTDASGRVQYDSRGLAVGQDFSRWNDVRLTLLGQYGARTTLEQPDDPQSAVMIVGAPIRDPRFPSRLLGVVSVAKPVASFGRYVQAARTKMIGVGVVSVLAVLLLAVIVSAWLVRPVGLLGELWAQTRRIGLAPRAWPRLARLLAASLRAAFDDMRDALAGRSYVADYVQTLTHELKSPLSAIRGAAELLQEPSMPAAERARFLANIERESGRIQELVDRMMELTALESRRQPLARSPVALPPLLEELAAAAAAPAARRGIDIALALPDAPSGSAPAADALVVQGDALLLRRAVGNLLDNALDFAPPGSRVELALERDGRQAIVVVRDRGPGVPDYARAKVWDKFYSLARPGSRKKSTGLGLPFVRAVAEQHLGRASLRNLPAGGCEARLALPLG